MKRLSDPATPTVLRRRDLDRLGITRKELRDALQNGQLCQVSRGLYYNPDGEITEKHSFAEVACRAPRAIFCLISALSFHQLTTQAEYLTWLALAPRAHPPKIDFFEVRLLRFSGEVLTAGVETHLCEGVPVRVYSPAKTVADLFRCEKVIGIDVALEALECAWLERRATTGEILHFARICGVEELIRPYLEDVLSRKHGELRWSGS